MTEEIVCVCGCPEEWHIPERQWSLMGNQRCYGEHGYQCCGGDMCLDDGCLCTAWTPTLRRTITEVLLAAPPAPGVGLSAEE